MTGWGSFPNHMNLGMLCLHIFEEDDELCVGSLKISLNASFIFKKQNESFFPSAKGKEEEDGERFSFVLNVPGLKF